MITLKEIEKGSKIIGVTKFGRFTVAELEFLKPIEPVIVKPGMSVETKSYKGVGIARQGEGDRCSEQIGQNIALSRAQKSLYRKVNGRNVNHVLMG